MANKPNIIVIGSFMYDLVVQTPRFPDIGETIVGSQFFQATGGKGANQALQAARLGARVTMAGKVGNDAFGDAHVESMREAGVDISTILRSETAPTGIGNISLDPEGRNKIIIVPGANMEITEAEIQSWEQDIADADMLILQLEIPLPCVYKAIQLAHQNNTPVMLNPAPAQSIDKQMVGLVTYLTPNETETAILTGVKVVDEASADQAAQTLLELGVQHVVITMGEHGVFYRDGKQKFFKEANKVKAVDTVAAGDSFIGALAFSLASGKGIEDSLSFSNKVAGISVTRYGAQPSLPHMHEVN
jgi:ribokinase